MEPIVPPYDIEERVGRHIFGRRLMRRFQNQNITDTVYVVSMVNDRWDHLRLINMEAEMTQMWSDLLEHLRVDENVLPTDLVRIHISHRELRKGDIVIPLQPLGKMSPDTIIDGISRVLQSYDHLMFRDMLEISIGVIKLPRGQGLPRKQLLGTSKDDIQAKNKSMVFIENDDGLCLARSLVVARANERFREKNMTKEAWRWIKDSKNFKQEEEARGLIHALGVSDEASSSMGLLPDYEHLLDRNIVVVGANHENKIVYPKPPLKYDKSYYLYYITFDDGRPGHFHTIINPKGFHGLDHFCEKCLTPYHSHSKQKHSCFATCKKCGSTDCAVTFPDDRPITCESCHVTFSSSDCYDRHLTTLCQKFWQCTECKRYLSTSDCPEDKHRCHTYMCRICKTWVDNDHHCYQDQQEAKEAVQKMIFFDAECTQDAGEHIPNLIVARVYHARSMVEQKIVYGRDVRHEFGTWLFNKKHRGHVILAHNLKGYDGYFILHYLIRNGIRHNVIYNGTKIMSIQVHNKLKMRIIDSLNFFPMPLSKLPKSFGLKNTKKGDFPHFFNVKENQNYIGPYPDPKYYGVDQKRSEERAQFLQWYESVKDGVFDFKKELVEYCINDVDILAKACLKFQKDFLHVTGNVDPFNCLTIASATMTVFKTKFLDPIYDVVSLEEGEAAEREQRLPNSVPMRKSSIKGPVKSASFSKSDIAIVPANGYTKRDNFSHQSIQWLKWIEYTESVRIQHAMSPEGEYKIPGTRNRVDGYAPSTNTVYQYMGCLWHGCQKCFGHVTTPLPRTGETQAVLYMKTVKGVEALRKLGYKVVIVWEHDFLQMIKNDPNMKTYLEGLDIQSRLNPRDSFFGGRTNACKLYRKAKEGEKIRYVDFTSLYPFVNKYARYPVGHPQIITDNFRDLSEYFGIAKVKISPPRGLYHPVLPLTSNGKLKFPLCGKCASTENPNPCRCSDEDRCILGTWCTPELEKAVQCGYKIRRVYEVYHFPETRQYDPQEGSPGLFTDFVNCFLKIKQESSGWPDWCQTEADQKDYVRKYKQKEGIDLDPDKIEKNPGRRSLAKLLLNSFWGKFAQRLNMPHDTYVTSEAEFMEIVLDGSKELSDFHIINENLCAVTYKKEEDFIEDGINTNVFLATFTTCWARLKLLDVLHLLGERVLYFDTDSVIFVEDATCPPVHLGDYLGELTDELPPGTHITEFASGGPKNYAYKMNNGDVCCKVKGFCLNYTNEKYVNFETIKNMIVNGCEDKISLPSSNKIARNKRTFKVVNREEDRQYRVVFTKRRKIDHYDSVPFGY